MVVQVLADAGKIGDDVDADRAQVIRRPDAGEEQQLRRADRPAADDHLGGVRALDASVARPFDADAARAVEQQPPCARSQRDLQAGMILDRAEVRGRRAVADAVLDAVLHVGDAVLRVAVVVRVERDAALPGRLDDRRVDRVRLEVREDAHRPGPRRRPPLDALVDGQHVAPRPAVGPEVRPRVEVRRRAAHPDHGVEAARASEHPSSRPRQPAARRVRLRSGLVGPVLLGEPELVDAARVVDGRIRVGPAGLEQEHADVAPVHEPPRHHRSGRAAADDDHIGREVRRHGEKPTQSRVDAVNPQRDRRGR